MTTALFWVMQQVVVIPYQRSETSYQSHCQWSRLHYSLHNNPEEHSSHLLCGRSLKSRISKLYLLSVIFFWQPTKTLLFENRQKITILWKYLLKYYTKETILIAKLLLPKLQYCLAIQNHLCKVTLHNENLIKDLISRTAAPALNGSYSICFSHKRFCCMLWNSVWQFCHICLTYTAQLYCIIYTYMNLHYHI